MTAMDRFPSDDAHMREWLRPVSGTLTPERCLIDTRGRPVVNTAVAPLEPRLASEMTGQEREAIMRTCYERGQRLTVAARLIGKSYDQTRILAKRLGLSPWSNRGRK